MSVQEVSTLRGASRAFRAMGSDCHVLIHAHEAVAHDLAALARERVEILEQCWSRFRPTSELNRLNLSAGRGSVPVSADMLTLVTRMRESWFATGGLFDPTVLTSMTALGYDVDLAQVRARPASAWQDVVLTQAPGMSAVIIDASSGTVALPGGVGLDPGAIGKGLAADIVADELLGAGATAVLVNLGGDIALRGMPTGQSAWVIDIADERRPGALLSTQALVGSAGGVATSTVLKRRWAQGRRHHVIDPRTGSMATGNVAQVTVVSESACRAEVLATAALCLSSQEAVDWLEDRALEALVLTSDETIGVAPLRRSIRGTRG